jgi:hypothetical protein
MYLTVELKEIDLANTLGGKIDPHAKSVGGSANRTANACRKVDELRVLH